MITCPHCGSSNRSGSQFCDICGRSLQSPTKSGLMSIMIGLAMVGLLLGNLGFLWWQILGDDTPTATPTVETTTTSTAPISATATSLLTLPTITFTVEIPDPIATTIAPIFIPGSNVDQ